MKRRHFLITPLVASAAATAPTDNPAAFTAYPRLYFTSPRIQQLRSRLKTDSALAQHWKNQIERAGRLLEGKLIAESEAKQGPGDDASFGRAGLQIFEMAFTLGLVYRVTGDK